jgi:hypothetical protein
MKLTLSFAAVHCNRHRNAGLVNVEPDIQRLLHILIASRALAGPSPTMLATQWKISGVW